jgi:diguanylate cyclase (GGDEF)-like protein
MGAALSAEVLFMEILNRLNTGMTYGIGGFMFFIFMPVVLFQCFSLRLNLVYTFVAAFTPHLLAGLDFAHSFQHNHYAVLIWPTAVMTMLVQFAFALSYLRRYESETALELASNTDAMTGASNRRHFMPLLRQEIIRGHRFKHRVSLLMLDIDHFKKVNDTYGHPTGDLVICTLADICRKESRQIDVVARLGGEEFAILLPETDIQEAMAMAERVRIAVEKTSVKSLGNVGFNFTVSIGAAEQPPEGKSEEELIGIADAALYQAKTSGRNRVISATKT